MTLTSIGDQARAYALQVATNRIKTTLATLTEEMGTGQVADIGQRLEGNTRALGEIEHRLRLTGQLRENGREAGVRLQAVQDMFENVRSATSEMGLALANDPFTTHAQRAARSTELSDAFDYVVRQLNGTNANRHLMAGEAGDVPPLTGAAAMLDSLEAVVAPLATAAEVVQAVSDWFDAPPGGGGFLDTAYRGTLDAPQRVAVGEDISIAFETTAASASVRDLLKGLATGAVLSRGVLAGDVQQQRALLTQTGMRLVAADGGVVIEMSRVGLAQQTVERAQAGATATLNTLERARSDIRSADPYETTAALTELEAQQKMLFAVTERLSRLRLVDYLR